MELAIAIAIRSGNLKSRHRATLDSSNAIDTASNETFTINISSPVVSNGIDTDEEIPHGTKMLTINDNSMSCFIADDHSMRARLLPEYSRTIAS